MVRVYYHDNLDTDPRLPHVGEPATLKDVEDLGIFAGHFDLQADVDKIAEDRGYMSHDEVKDLLTFL